jgi:Adenosylmethionine decarboxylase
MFDMAPEVANIFFKVSPQGRNMTGKEMTAKSGIDHLCPGATIDETAFTPCGYSMNAILHDSYFTIHITPEKECSYASFETNTCLRDYGSMVRNVLNVFRPKRFVLTMFGDEGTRNLFDIHDTKLTNESLSSYAPYHLTPPSTFLSPSLCLYFIPACSHLTPSISILLFLFLTHSLHLRSPRRHGQHHIATH